MYGKLKYCFKVNFYLTLGRKIFRNSILWLIVAILHFAAAESKAQKLRRFVPPGAYGKPNIILLAADGFNYQDFEFIKKSPSDFPNLNTLVSNSVIFTRYYNSSFRASEVYASFLFGFNAVSGQYGQSNIALAVNSLPLAKALKECDYFTGVLGKWCIGDEVNQPVKMGFDQWFGYLTQQESTNLFPHFLWRNEKKFYLSENQGNAKVVPAQRWFNTTTTNFLRIYREYPFFLYLPSVLPGNRESESNAQLIDKKEVASKITESRRKSLKELDAYLGLIINYLKIFKIPDKTLIILTGVVDVEDELKEILEKQGDLQRIADSIESKLHVPMIISWEGTIKSETVNNSLIMSYDVYPTILQLADGRFPTNSCEFPFAEQIMRKTNAPLTEFVFWKIEKSNYDWIIRLDGYYAGYSDKDKKLDFKTVDKEIDINVGEAEVKKRVIDFVSRITNGLPRIKPQKK